MTKKFALSICLAYLFPTGNAIAQPLERFSTVQKSLSDNNVASATRDKSTDGKPTVSSNKMLKGNIDSVSSPLNVRQRKAGTNAALIKLSRQSGQLKKLLRGNVQQLKQNQQNFILQNSSTRILENPVKLRGTAKQSETLAPIQDLHLIKIEKETVPTRNSESAPLKPQLKNVGREPKSANTDLVPLNEIAPTAGQIKILPPQISPQLKKLTDQNPHDNDLTEKQHRGEGLLKLKQAPQNDLNAKVVTNRVDKLPEQKKKVNGKLSIPKQTDDLLSGNLLKPDETGTSELVKKPELGNDLLQKAITKQVDAKLKPPKERVQPLAELKELRAETSTKLKIVFKNLQMRKLNNADIPALKPTSGQGILWDEWYARVGRLSEPLLIKWFAIYGNPAGKSTIELTVRANQTITTRVISEEAPTVSKAIIEAYAELSGDERLAFPAGSQRDLVSFEIENEHLFEGDVSGVNTELCVGDKE